MHKRFAHLRLRREWFTYCPSMLGDVGLEPMPQDELPEVIEQQRECEAQAYAEANGLIPRKWRAANRIWLLSGGEAYRQSVRDIYDEIVGAKGAVTEGARHA